MNDLAGYFKVIFYGDPFGDQAIDCQYLEGLYISDILARIQADHDFADVYISGNLIHKSIYHLVKPKAGAVVLVEVKPGAAIAVAAVGAAVKAAVASQLAATALSAIAVTIISSVAGAVVAGGLSMLIAPDAPSANMSSLNGVGDASRQSPTYSISGARNDARPFQPIPVIMGEHKQVPPYGASPYTEIVGNDQYLRFVVVWGYGPIDVEDIKIGNTPISQFEDIDQEHDFDGTQGSLALYPNIVRQENLNITLDEAFQTRRTPIQVNDFGVTISFPRGLGTVNNNTGERLPLSCTLTGQYRKVGDIDWTEFFNETVRGNTSEVIRKSYRIGQIGSTQVKDYSGETLTSQGNLDRHISFLYNGIAYRGITVPLINQLSLGLEVAKVIFSTPFDLGGIKLHNVRADNQYLKLQYSTDSGVSWTDYGSRFQCGAGGDYRLGLVRENVNGVRLITDSDFTNMRLGEFTIYEYDEDSPQLSPDQYDVRIKRSALSANTNARDDAVWTAFRSFENRDPIQEPGLAKSAFRVRATDQLNGVIDQLNAVCFGKYPTWTGTAWTTTNQRSSNPAAIYRYALSGTPNPKALDTQFIDDDGLGAWYEFCETEGFRYDKIIDYDTSVSSLLKEIAAAGYASPTNFGDLRGVFIDTVRPSPVQQFTPHNTFNIRGAVTFSEVPQALRVRFPNRLKDYREDERIVYDDGYDSTNATKFDELELAGQTDPDNVYRLARRFMAAIRLRPEIVTFSTDIENIRCNRGDLITLNNDVLKIGLYSGRVKSIAGSDITLDSPVVMESGKSYGIQFRLEDFTSKVTTVTTQAGTVSTVTVADPTGVNVGDLFSFGLAGQESSDFVIKAIELQDDLIADIECLPYSPEIFNSADIIPTYQSSLSDRISYSLVGPVKPKITNLVSDEAALVRNTSGSLNPSIIVYFSPGEQPTSPNSQITYTDGYRVRYRASNSGESWKYLPSIPASANTAVISNVLTGSSYDIGVQAIDRAGNISDWAYANNHVVLGAIAKPPPINSFSMNTNAGQAYLEWTYPDQPIDAQSYEIRYHPDQNFTNWGGMTTIASNIPKDARSYTVPSRSGSYAIKAVDIVGNKSTSALFVNASLRDPSAFNVVQTITENPSFSGAKANVDLIDGKLQLSSASVMADWATLSEVTSMTYGSGQGFNPQGYYYFSTDIDLGSVQSFRVQPNLTISSLDFLNVMANWNTLSEVSTLAGTNTGDDYSVNLEISYSTDDNLSPTFTDYRPVVSGDYTARHAKFRLSMSSRNIGITPLVSSASVTVDMPDELRSGNDISSGASVYSVTFSPALYVLQSVNVTAQDMETGDYYVITNKSASGFDIEFKNSSGTTISRTFDYQAFGYGRQEGT